MSQELHYTSVPRGLKPGSRGFCTVASTPGASSTLVERLESLSAYQPVYAVHDPAAASNPVNFMHLKPAIGGKSLSVLSRIGPAGLDYSGRTNKYAHHIVLDANERPAGGPAWLLSQPGFLQDGWRGEPRILPEGTRPPQGDRPPGIARAWAASTGDAGWAGSLAEAFLADPRRTALVVFRPGIDLLPLFVEAIALLPPERRWDVEFSTFFATLPPGVNCCWRGVIEGSPEAEAALRLASPLVINLCRPIGKAAGGDLVHQARTGERPVAAGADDVASTNHPPGRRAPTTAGRHAAPPLRPPAASHDVLPPSQHGARIAFHKPAQTWAITAGIVAACLIGLVATVLFLLPRTRALPPVARAETPLKSPESNSAAPDSAPIPDGKTKVASPEIKPEDPALAAIKKDAEPTSPIAGKTKTDSGKDGQNSRTYIAALGLPLNTILGEDGPPTALPKPRDPSNDPKPMLKRNVVLALELKEPGKEARGAPTLDLEQYMAVGDAASELALIRLNKPANDSGKLPHAKPNPSDPTALDVMTSVITGLDRKEQALAHFKAEGRTVKFNWDEEAKSGEALESRNFLRECILKIVTKKRDVLYALLRERPPESKGPLRIRRVAAAGARRPQYFPLKNDSSKRPLTADVDADSLDRKRYGDLFGRIVIMNVRAKVGSSKTDLTFKKGDEPGEWLCDGPRGPIMKTEFKTSDSKLRFTFLRNPFQLESQLSRIEPTRADSMAPLEVVAKDPNAKPGSDQEAAVRIKHDLHLIDELLDAEYSVVLGLKIDEENSLELVRIGSFANEKTP